MTIAPDTKDWTWVLGRPCPECGLDTREVTAADVARRLRDNAAAWAPVLADPEVRRRRRPDTWSPLEYGCHVRDVFRIGEGRLERMLTEDDPLYAKWDQDATAEQDAYATQDPVVVARDVRRSGEALAARLDTVRGTQWHRPGRRSDGASFTVLSFARYLVHDPVHHLWDVTGRRA